MEYVESSLASEIEEVKRKDVLVSDTILNAEPVSAPLEEAHAELAEVVVTPYSLTEPLENILSKN